MSRDLRRRTDSKFVLSPAGAVDLVSALNGDYAVLTAGAGRVASYRTLYFDTQELDFFHAHRRGRRVRHKVRIRHYPDRHLTLLEVKTRRSELETNKVWRERQYGDDVLTHEDQVFVDANTGVGRDVLPEVWTDFRRVTLLGLHNNERVTIDFNLEVSRGARRRSLAGIAIVEVKQWPFLPASAVMSALRAAGQRPGWASKYCTAVAFTRPGLRFNALLPGLRALERRAA